MARKSVKINWKDTNLEFIGSADDRQVKKESALTEPAWSHVLTQDTPALFIWRIEQFKVVEWPKSDYGKFYSGDSYIVLNIYQLHGNPELLYDIHFWIGMHSSQDEYGTAAYKTVELDTLLDDKPIQHREVEGFESDLFKSYFPVITYMKGGCACGFRQVTTEEYQPRLLHFSGDKARQIVVREVKASKSSLDSGDVFILDLGNKAYQWNGANSSKDERFKAGQYLQGLKAERHGKVQSEVLDEGDAHESLSCLSDEPSKKTFKSTPEDSSHEKHLFKLSDENGKLEFTQTETGDFSKDIISEDDVWIIDNGKVVYVYVGENASLVEKQNALIYAHNYLKQTSYPYLPVSVVRNNDQGPTYNEFQSVMVGS